jgi:hypothetical protein
MAIAYTEMRRIRNLEWDVGTAAPGSRRSPIEQAGLGLAGFARALKEALMGRQTPSRRAEGVRVVR